MERYSICKNPSCRFVLDRRVKGESLEISQYLKKCPACGAGWSSACPFCNRALTINFVGGLLTPRVAGTGCLRKQRPPRLTALDDGSSISQPFARIAHANVYRLSDKRFSHASNLTMHCFVQN
jgi:hypothetical protein